MTSVLRRGAALALLAAPFAAISFADAQQAPPQTPPAQQSAPSAPPLTNPAAFTETAPAEFVARFDTTAGAFTAKVHRDWAPNGADRFYNLVKAGFYDQCRIFRVVPGFVMQFGINGNPQISQAWANATIPRDRARISNTRGRITFAMTAIVTSRSTQVFINFDDNSRKLDLDGFAPFGEVTQGMALLDRVYDKYGESPDQNLMMLGGNAYLAQLFPHLDYIRTATITK